MSRSEEPRRRAAPLAAGVPAALLGALAALGLGCGSSPPPDTGPVPPPSRTPPSRAASAGAPPAGRAVLVGEMCPAAAAGRPSVRPLFRRQSGWTDEAAAVAAPIERWQARQFAVLGWNGRRAGVFSVAGAATVDGRASAIGGYAGSSPCEKPRGAGGAIGERDPECATALRDCGLAVAEVERTSGFQTAPGGEMPEPIPLDVGGAAVCDGQLVVDIDGDASPERYPVAGLIAADGGPSEAVDAAAGSGQPPRGDKVGGEAGGACSPRFARGQIAPGVDVIGVLDLDADGRKDLVLAFSRGGKVTWALYASTADAGRLDRVAVGFPWPAR